MMSGNSFLLEMMLGKGFKFKVLNDFFSIFSFIDFLKYNETLLENLKKSR
jgi:hypothetical protein